MSVAGWFTPYDQSTLSQADGDLGSGAAVLLPDQISTAGPKHLLHVFNFPGTTPSVSSQGPSHGVVWAIDASLYGYASPNAGVNCYTVPVPPACTGPAVLHAYDATNLTVEYWNSSMAASNRDRAGNAVKFVPPTVANGKVYVATRTGIYVYGLLPN